MGAAMVARKILLTTFSTLLSLFGRGAATKSGIRTPVAWLEARNRATGPIPPFVHKKPAEGEGVEPSRLVARSISNRVPSPIGLPFLTDFTKHGKSVEHRRKESNLQSSP